MAVARVMTAESGLLLINKPRGMTSFGVVSLLRRLTGIRRIGHAGTLDPFADGLLVFCLGRAAAAVQFMERYDKTYRVGVAFGRATDTQDLTGQTTFTRELSASEREELLQTDFAPLRLAVQDLVGEQQQLPPMFSAVKVAGRPLYAYARQGREIARPSRLIRVYRAVVEEISLQDTLQAALVISCSKGAYIRTLADGLGQRLGLGAHASSLTRLRCGPFELAQALETAQLQAWADEFPDQASFRHFLAGRNLLLPVDRAFAGFPALPVSEAEAERLICGQQLRLDPNVLAGRLGGDRPGSGEQIAVTCQGRVIAVIHLADAAPDSVQLVAERVLVDLADFRQS